MKVRGGQSSREQEGVLGGGAHFIPEKRMVLWEPQAPPRVHPSGRGCSQSGSGRLTALDMGSYSMASSHGITFTSLPPAASRIALTCITMDVSVSQCYRQSGIMHGRGY